MAKIVAVCTSPKKGMQKVNQGTGTLIREYGLEGDAHAGKWHRQVSLLAQESIDKMIAQGVDVGPGDFAENITTEGIELYTLPVGTRLRLGGTALAEVTQIGKECHHHCAVYQQVGDCVMPREGIFIRILRGGEIAVGDPLEVSSFITVGVLIASDKGARGERQDGCRAVIEEKIAAINGEVVEYAIVPDEREIICDTLTQWVDEGKIDLIFTSGGTGFSPRDITPEAVLDIVERQVPGIPEAMRAASLAITPRAMLTRAVAGIRGKSLIITLPGSPKAVGENLDAILAALPHGIDILRGVTGECARA